MHAAYAWADGSNICRRNTLNYDMRDDIVRIFREMDRDDDVRAVVMTGAPNKGNAFCAGVGKPNKSCTRVIRA